MGGLNDPDFSNGIYFYSIYTGNYQKVMKMLLVKKFSLFCCPGIKRRFFNHLFTLQAIYG